MIFFYLLVAILPLSDHHILGRSFGGLTIFKALGCVCIVHAMIRMLMRPKRPRLLGTWQARLSLTFFLITIVSFLIAADYRNVDYSVPFSCISFIALWFIVVSVVDSVEKLRATLLWVVGSVGVAS